VTAIEEARRREEVSARLVADLTAGVNRELKKGAGSHEYHDYWLVLTNRGPAVAEDVDVHLLAEKDGGEPPELSKGGHFPVTLDAGQEYRVWLMVSYGMSPNFRADLRWQDGRGEQRKTLALTL
jgi:hypothetical protein